MAAMPLMVWAERMVSYARANQNVTLDLEWTADNYGDITWQISTDNGATWTDVNGATGPTYTFKVTAPMLCRAVVKGDPACPAIIKEREVRPVSFDANVVTLGSNSAELEISNFDFKGADVVEYGYAALIQGTGRTYSAIPRIKVGDALPEGDAFTIALLL